MKAIVRDTYSSPEVLGLRDIDKPEIADGSPILGCGRLHSVFPGQLLVAEHVGDRLPRGCAEPLGDL